MLKFDYDLVHAKIVQVARGFGRQVMNDGSVSYERIAIAVGEDAIVIEVDIDTDELVVSLGADDDRLDPIPELQELVGKELGWCWEGRNYLGYWDFFGLSVNGIVPGISFAGMASSIRILKIAPLEAGGSC